VNAFAFAVALVLILCAADAYATGIHRWRRYLRAQPETLVRLDGVFRLRGEADHNFDLDRGTTAAGTPLFFTPLADPTAQGLSHGDLRSGQNLAFYAPLAESR